MKNLKKVLALVLVVAMMMGFATVAGAADFTDAADVSHDEAVDVMTAIGVINGYPDGSFRPEGNVTRAQMAKMVAYIVAGGEDVGDLYAGATAFSDCLTHWARGYIAYANTTGIIAGVGGGRFNPDGNVTGAQAAKMMLCALGYNQDTEGYTGTGWSVNVLSDARTLGLLKGLSGVNMNAYLNREDAAQLMFNALQATMVEYDRGTITVDGGDATVVIGGSEAGPVVNESFDYQNRGNGYGAGNDRYMQMCEMYFEDLSLDSSDRDDFKRPAKTWSYDKDVIGTYVSDDTVVVYTADTSNSDVRSDLRNYEYASGLYAVVNSDRGARITDYTDVADLTDDGKIVEVYADNRTITDVVVVETEAAEVIAVNDRRETFTIQFNGTDTEVIDEDSDFFDLYDDVEEDDILVVSYNAAGDVLDLYIPETVSGEITYVDSDEATIGGESVTANENVALFSSSQLGKEATVYLNAAGYVVSVSLEAASGAEYMYVTNLWSDATGNYGNTTYYARGVMADGTIETIEIANTKNGTTSDEYTMTELETLGFEDLAQNGSRGGTKLMVNTTAGRAYPFTNGAKPNVLLQYTESTVDSGVYMLTNPLAASGTSGVVTVTGGASSGLSASDPKIGSYYMTSDVDFVYASGSGDSVSASVGEKAAIANNVTYYGVVEEVDGVGRITVVFISGASTASEDVIYISKVGGGQRYTDADGNVETGTRVTYYAYGDTEPSTMTVSRNTEDAPAVGFFTTATDGESYSLFAYGDEGTNKYTSTVVTGMYNGYLSVSGHDDFDVSEAEIVDTTDNGIDNVTTLENEVNAPDQEIKVSFTYSANSEVETVYVQSVKSADATLRSVTFNGQEVTLYTDRSDAWSNPITLEVAANSSIDLSIIPTDDDAEITHIHYDNDWDGSSSPSWTEADVGDTIPVGADNDQGIIRIDVMAADGTSTSYAFFSFTVDVPTR